MILISLLIRLAGAGALLWWYWTGSRLAGVIMFALIAVAIEVLHLSTPVVRRHREP